MLKKLVRKIKDFICKVGPDEVTLGGMKWYLRERMCGNHKSNTKTIICIINPETGTVKCYHQDALSKLIKSDEHD